MILLTVSDLIITRRRSSAAGALAGYIEYETAAPREMGAAAYFALVLLKISPPFLITLIWAAAKASGSEVVAQLYAGLLGFALGLYLILNLRHLESSLIDRLARKLSDDLSGRVFIKRRFSLGQSTVQLGSLFIVLAIIAAIRPAPLYAGFALAPAALIARNLILIIM